MVFVKLFIIVVLIVSPLSQARSSDVGRNIVDEIIRDIQDVFDKITGNERRNNDDDPSRTKLAPFGEDEVIDNNHLFADLKKDDFLSKYKDLSIRHRNNYDIAKWASGSASEALTFELGDIGKREIFLLNKMTSSGRKEYNDFLTETKILDIMKNYNYRLVAIIDEPPELKKDGNFGGYYRWLYDVPIKISYVPIGLKSYDHDDIPRSQDIIIELQVTRVGAKISPHDIKIEGWKLKGLKKKPKK